MRGRLASAAVGVCGMAVAGAGAQPLESIDFTVVWDKAVIAPDETNTGHVIATIGPEIGSIVAWNTPPGTGQLGELRCFGWGKLDFVNKQHAELGKLSWAFPASFMVLGKGVPNGSGSVSGLEMKQSWNFPSPNFGQSLAVVDVQWTAPAVTPTEPYFVEYTTNIIFATAALDVGLSDWVHEKAVFTNGMGGFVVTPAPAGFALIGVAAGWVRRRRR